MSAENEPNAAARVFGTMELLEMIIARLPPLDIIVSKRVSVGFAVCIITSQSIQDIIMPPAQREEWWALQEQKQEIVFADDEFRLKMRDDPRLSPLRPMVPNNLLFHRSPFNVFSDSVDAEANIRLDLHKVNGHSSCLAMPLIVGPGVSKAVMVYQAYDIDLDEFAADGFIRKDRNICFRDVWELITQDGNWDLSLLVSVDFIEDNCLVTEQFLEHVRATGRYRLPAIQRGSINQPIVEGLARFISDADAVNLRSSCAEMRHCFGTRNLQCKAFFDQTRVPEQMWVIDARGGGLYGVVARIGHDILSNDRKLSDLRLLILLQNPLKTHHYIGNVLVYNNSILERDGVHTPIEHGHAGYAQLKLTISEIRLPPQLSVAQSKLPSPLKVDGSAGPFMSLINDQFVTLPPTKTLQVENNEMGHTGRGTKWVTVNRGSRNHPCRVIEGNRFKHAEKSCAFIHCRRLYHTVRLNRGTGRIRIPGAVAVTKHEWNVMQEYVKEVTYDDVLGELAPLLAIKRKEDPEYEANMRWKV